MYRQSEKLFKQQYLLHRSPQYGELRPTGGWDRFGSLGYPANFNGFRVWASLLRRHRSTEVNKTLQDVWPSPRLVHYIYIHFRGLLQPNGILPCANFTLRPNLEFSYIGSVTARHCSCRREPITLRRGTQGMELRNLYIRRHLCSAGRPSRWASAHILVVFSFFIIVIFVWFRMAD